MQRPRETLTHGPVTLHRWRAGAGPAAELAQAVAESSGLLRPFMPWARGEYGLADAEQFLDFCEQGWEAGTEFSYAIRSGGELAGGAGLMARIGPGGLEIGYWVHPASTRRGVATAAAAALTCAALALPGIDHVEIHHDVLNLASGRVPAKLSYVHIDTRESRLNQAPGDSGTDEVWRITR
jgi:ribosomal-protein-serine acetyltransferase